MTVTVPGRSRDVSSQGRLPAEANHSQSRDGTKPVQRDDRLLSHSAESEPVVAQWHCLIKQRDFISEDRDEPSFG